MAIVMFFLSISSTPLYSADLLGDILKKGLPQLPGGAGLPVGQTAGKGLEDHTIVSGLKEALSIGTENALSFVSKLNGYFGNEAIKILLPDKIQKAAKLVGELGYQKQVDEFIMSMNHAAEKAAPKAASYFGEAIKEMSIEDARKILSGGTRRRRVTSNQRLRPSSTKNSNPASPKAWTGSGSLRGITP